MNKLHEFNLSQLAKLTEDKEIPQVKPGQTLRVHVRIVEGNNERIQIFEGVCIAIRNRGLLTSFRVRKISHGVGVEKVFLLYSRRIEKIEIMKVGKVRRAKLYYLRDLKGKAARIPEKMEYNKNNKSSKS